MSLYLIRTLNLPRHLGGEDANQCIIQGGGFDQVQALAHRYFPGCHVETMTENIDLTQSKREHEKMADTVLNPNPQTLTIEVFETLVQQHEVLTEQVNQARAKQDKYWEGTAAQYGFYNY